MFVLIHILVFSSDWRHSCERNGTSYLFLVGLHRAQRTNLEKAGFENQINYQVTSILFVDDHNIVQYQIYKTIDRFSRNMHMVEWKHSHKKCDNAVP